MSKTPEQLANDYANMARTVEGGYARYDLQVAFLIGYKAATGKMMKASKEIDPTALDHVTQKYMEEFAKDGPWVQFWTKTVRNK